MRTGMLRRRRPAVRVRPPIPPPIIVTVKGLVGVVLPIVQVGLVVVGKSGI